MSKSGVETWTAPTPRVARAPNGSAAFRHGASARPPHWNDVWAEYPSDKLSSIFDTKKLICPCIVEVEGSNSYQMPHKKKAKTA